MSQKRQQHISVFEIPEDLLAQLEPVEKDTEAVWSLAAENQEQQNDDVVNSKALERLQIQEDRLANQDNELTCNTCAIEFQDRGEQRQHFSTDWHRYNIKRKVVLDAKPVTLPEFEAILTDLTESISGSEGDYSEDEDEEEGEKSEKRPDLDSIVDRQKQRQEQEEKLANEAKQIVLPVMKKHSALAWFKTPEKDASSHYGIYRHLLQNSTLAQLQRSQHKGKKRTWTIIMLGGGHFAGCVIDVDASISDVKLIQHKTFHRYTTRRKQGGSQSANDNAKGAANSAGAQIRRYNEQLLQQQVRAVLSQWHQYIAQSEMVLVHAPSGNRKLVYNYEGAVLDANQVRSIPFATRRPTLSELKRVFTEMTTVKQIQVDEQAMETCKQKWIEKEKKAKCLLERSTMAAKKAAVVVKKDTVNPHLEKLLNLVRQNKTSVTLGYLEKHMDLPVRGRMPAEEVPDDEDLYHYPTLLHVAANTGGAADLVKALLIQYDADPTVISDAGKTAYEVSKDKETRNAFRRCMCDYPDKWRWLEDGRVPSPLTEQQELDQLAKEKKKQAKEQEKKRLLDIERQKMEAAKEAKEEEARFEKLQAARAKSNMMPIVRRLGGDSVMNTANMTPEARMRLEREKRARAAEDRLKRLQ
ncbi:hypothetical protein [Parasitella parasitica]|uniref:VLRF1 domain-containing protein n=1 Tax=Parasitella parasitica TaxID=35722 RepID=A0A0B7NB07_9FUNG|nr:hypothetical protein [Parasitella parasitica]